MRTTIIILAVLLTGCSAKEIKPELDPVKVGQAIQGLGKNDSLFIQGFKELEARLRKIEEKLKIPSPVIPTPVQGKVDESIKK